MQWFPGHMARALKELEAASGAVDVICEIIDARIPLASHNPLFDPLFAEKPLIKLAVKADLADPETFPEFAAQFRADGVPVLFLNSKGRLAVSELSALIAAVLAPENARRKARGMLPRPPRVLVVGVPNVGKSTLINRLKGRRAAAVGNRPGITRSQQWITTDSGFELLDTPGLLWQKFATPEQGIKLALCGALADKIYDYDAMAGFLITHLEARYPGRLAERYGAFAAPEALYAVIAEKAGFKGEDARQRAQARLISDFQKGRIGRVTLD